MGGADVGDDFFAVEADGAALVGINPLERNFFVGAILNALGTWVVLISLESFGKGAESACVLDDDAMSEREALAEGSPCVIAMPAKGGEPASKGARDAWRQPAVRVGEAFGVGVARGRVLQSDDALPALAGRAAVRVEQEVGFAGEAEQNGGRDV